MNVISPPSPQPKLGGIPKSLPKILKHPLFILGITACGVFLGLFQPDLALKVNLVGSVYIDLLKLCVGPIVLSCVALGLFELLTHRSNWVFILRLCVFLALGVFLCSLIATIVGIVAAPGQSMSESTLGSLGIVVNQKIVDFSLNLNSPNPVTEPQPVFRLFIEQLIPDNAIAPLVSNEILKVIVVASILGVGMTLIPPAQSDNLKNLLVSVRLTFNKILVLLTYILPFALFSIVSYTVATVDGAVFLSLIKFIIATILTFLLISALSVGLIVLRSKRDPWTTLHSIMEVSVVALATQNVMATLPQSLNSLSVDVRLEETEVNIALPLVMTMGRFGNVAYFALASILAAFIYDKTLGFSTLAIVVLLNIFSGVATAGAIGIATLTMISLTLDILQIPTEAILTLLIVIDPIIAPVRVLLTVLASMGVVAWVVTPESDEPAPLTALEPQPLLQSS
ncbi:dicarboxylate/amino acid:cation symporter [Prochlorothrix hollandica]|uniref:dicarboxylate/amino acid:cation symporter n=1 Tax=Prochlorothrix hollandica TaxID=1223 RepID=UPI0009DADC55|nr:cation:dicarboxylase symporter family transporter [Prochlorothrix hollandica]